MAAAALWLGACATLPTPTPEPPGLPDGIYRASDGERLSLDDLLRSWEALPGEGPLVIYVAETHDNVVHHQVQRQLLEALMRRYPGRVGLGMEMFPTPLQPVLDAFCAGDIDAQTLRTRTEWDEIWGFDFGLYSPMLDLVSLQRAPLVALNAPQALTRKLSKVGVEGLTAEERAALPATFGNDNPAHREMIREVLGSMHAMDAAAFERFYAAQRAWDATMAASINDFLLARADVRALMVIAGGYHVYRGLGIPWHVDAGREVPVRGVIMVPVDASERRFGAEDLLGNDTGDYFWVSSPTDESRP